MTDPQLTPALRRAYQANIRWFYLYKFVANFQFWFPIWVLYLQVERGLSLTQVTALDAPFWLVMVLAEVPTGAIADRWGRRLSLLLGAIGFAAAVFIFGISTTYWWLLLSYLIWGVAMTLSSGADTAFLYDTLVALGRASEFSRVLGRARAAEMAAGLAGALAGAPMAAATNLSFPIIVSAGIALLGATILLRCKEPARHASTPQLPYFQVLGATVRYLRTQRPLQSMIVLNAVLAGAGMAGFIFVQPFLARHQVPVDQFGLYSTPGRLLSVAGSLLAYRLAAWLGERNLLLALLAAFSGALLVLGSVPTMIAFAMFPVLSFATATLSPVTSDFVNRHSPQHLRATLASVSQMASSVVLAVFEPLLGFTGDHWSLQRAFLTGGAVVVVCGVPAYIWWVVERRRAAAIVTEADASNREARDTALSGAGRD